MPLPLPPNRRQTPCAAGFTLIELMIVVVIVAILAAVALPIYQSQIMRSRRVDAKSAVLELAARQEKYFAMNNKFSMTASDLGYPTLPWDIVSSGGTSYYRLTVTTSNSNQAFTAVATPTGSQMQDSDCFAYAIDQTGNKSNQNRNRQPIISNACW